MITKINKADINEIIKIEKSVLGSTLGITYYTQAIEDFNLSHLFKVEYDNIIIGYLVSKIYNDNLEIINIAISKKHQKKGYGQMLFDYVLNYSLKYNVRLITLEVRVSNKKAINFYEKNGFKRILIKPNYYINEDAFYYIKEVKK